MTKTPISVQDLRRRIYVKAKAEPTWRFWGLYVHICKMETLQGSPTKFGSVSAIGMLR
jgi:RNA-directed DNA polymerase